MTVPATQVCGAIITILAVSTTTGVARLPGPGAANTVAIESVAETNTDATTMVAQKNL